MIERLVERAVPDTVTAERVVRALGVAMSAACIAATVGAVWILLRDDGRTFGALAYPALFGVASVAWWHATWRTSTGNAATAVVCTLVPATSRAIDFVASWGLDPDDITRPGSRLVGVAAWTMVSTLTATVGALLAVRR